MVSLSSICLRFYNRWVMCCVRLDCNMGMCLWGFVIGVGRIVNIYDVLGTGISLGVCWMGGILGVRRLFGMSLLYPHIIISLYYILTLYDPNYKDHHCPFLYYSRLIH